MRKLLLTSSALVVSCISSYATADVSVTGAFGGLTVQHHQTLQLQMVMQWS